MVVFPLWALGPGVDGHETGMQLQEMSSARLRALSEVEIPAGRVISLYLNLDPETFGTLPARGTAIRSVIDELGRRMDAVAGELTHDELVALREDRARIEAFLTHELDVEGAHGLAIFACGPAGLWEVARLAHPVAMEVATDTVPHVQQLAGDADDSKWAVAVVSRSRGRIFRGDTHRLDETLAREDDIHGQHDQGGWSQPRYQRSVDREAEEHVEAVMDELCAVFRKQPFDHLVVIAASELWPSIERAMHPDLARRLAGRVDADAERARPDEVFALAHTEMARVEREQRRDLLDRLSHGLATGERAAAGLPATLDALVQRRVEALLLAEGFAAPGATCPECGWIGPDRNVERCPVDGTAVHGHDNIANAAIASALHQDAAVVVIPRYDEPDHPDAAPSAGYLQLQGPGGIAAVLRF